MIDSNSKQDFEPGTHWVCLRNFQCGGDFFAEGEELVVISVEHSPNSTEVEFLCKSEGAKIWRRFNGQEDYSHLILKSV